MGVFIGLVKLGFWQLSRAEQKLALQRQADSAVISVSGRLASEKRIWLDNKTWHGRAGYQLLVAVETEPDQPWRLVNLGWVAQGPDRQRLPELPELSAQLMQATELITRFDGELRKPSQLFLLGESEPPLGDQWRVQSLELASLSQWLGHALAPEILLLSPAAEPKLPRDWRIAGISVEKHRAYAAQWFALALTWLVMCAVFTRVRYKESKQ